MYKTFLKSLALKIFQNFYKHRSLGSTVLFKITTGAWAKLIVLKYKRESVLNRCLLNLYGSLGHNRASNLYGSLCSTVHQWLIFQNCMIMLIKHQPPEAYTCLLYPSEHGSLGIYREVEGPVSASPFLVNMVELTWVSITII